MTYGLHEVPQALLLKIAEQVGLSDLIRQMPRGLESSIGEMGTLLSGGEKQKIALARAILLKPKVLLLDETLNSLNAESEKMILKALFSSIPTIILISHRASTLQHMDRLFKLQRGQLFEVDISTQLDNDLALANRSELEICIPSF